MNDYIGKELEKRYNEYKADAANTRSKAVIDIVLQAYMPEDAKTAPAKLDPEFRAFAIRQIRLFVFAGHDSTSSTICYTFHLLATNPETLTYLRAEHDAVFGKDRTATQSLLESRPHLTECLPYTTAIIKQILRLFTPAGSSKAGKPRVNLTDDAGNHCPTDDATVFFVHVEMHRSPKYWIRPDDFLPERWLVDPGHDLNPMKGAVSILTHLLFRVPSKIAIACGKLLSLQKLQERKATNTEGLVAAIRTRTKELHSARLSDDRNVRRSGDGCEAIRFQTCV